MRFAERLVETAERVVGRMPRNAAARDVSHRVDRLRGRLDFVKRYAGLYGSYVEVEAIYTDDRARELFGSLPPEDRRDFNFDPTSFTWEHYFKGVHLPAISAPMRWLAQTPTRPTPSVAISPVVSGNGSLSVLAVFDVEGTLVESNVVEAYLWLRLAETGGLARAREVASVAARVPTLLNAERRDRGEFLRMFYRQYEGASASDVRALAASTLPDLFLRRLSAAAVRRIRKHREAGHTVVFITGALDFIVEPIAGLADVIVTAKLQERDGIFIGDLERPPLVGEARASWLRDYARATGADLEASYAYADSMSDLPLLEAVGNPAAVNPDVALARIARKRRWPVEEWSAGKGAPKIMMPQPLTEPVG
jgi:HAD superfamily hydrolase (TIGR01490 family)